jgi:hypothetical protein
VPFDRVHKLAVLAVLTLHMDRNEGMQRRNQKGRWKDEPEQDAGHDQDEIEDRRERLAVQQKAERRQKNRKQIDHRQTPEPSAVSYVGRRLAEHNGRWSKAAPIL